MLYGVQCNEVVVECIGNESCIRGGFFLSETDKCIYSYAVPSSHKAIEAVVSMELTNLPNTFTAVASASRPCVAEAVLQKKIAYDLACIYFKPVIFVCKLGTGCTELLLHATDLLTTHSSLNPITTAKKKSTWQTRWASPFSLLQINRANPLIEDYKWLNEFRSTKPTRSWRETDSAIAKQNGFRSAKQNKRGPSAQCLVTRGLRF